MPREGIVVEAVDNFIFHLFPGPMVPAWEPFERTPFRPRDLIQLTSPKGVVSVFCGRRRLGG